MSGDAKFIVGLIIAAAIFASGYYLGSKGSCKCGQSSQQQQQGNTQPGLKPIKVPQ